MQPGSVDHRLGDIVMAALATGFSMDGIGEYAPDATFAERLPRAEKYVGWPMLLVLRLGVPPDDRLHPGQGGPPHG